ncbi:MAG: DNA-binding transcriptional regulator [Phycisphaerales bacterium]|jgi:LacI family transcriptional regulator|nr:DNA-binding transcriptional regulator [Phycisphaerales bacterium]MBT7171524.1 DNA-binding transcriptional regulator [Phycisphaerales bacterium]
MPKRKKILIALCWYNPGMELGISRYAREHHWQLVLDMAYNQIIPWNKPCDGVLTYLGSNPQLAEFASRQSVPVVDLSTARSDLALPRVTNDNAALGKLAAEHFLAKRFRNFLYYTRDAFSARTSIERGLSFQRTVEDAGHSCEIFRISDEAATRDPIDLLAEKIESLPKPLAVFAHNDPLAAEVLEACQSRGIKVPEEVAVLGTGNALLTCEYALVPLSSIDRNMEELGYRAAEILDGLIDGKPRPTESILVPPAGVAQRESTDIIAVSHPQVAKALRYIWTHYHEAIGVDNVVAETTLSRTGLQKAFRKHLGRLPGEEIRQYRIARAKELLAETDEKVRVIALKTGHCSATNLCAAFRREVGMNPKAYRNQHRAPAEA